MHCAPSLHLMSSHSALSRQSFVHVDPPPLQVPLQIVESLQSKLQNAPLQMPVHVALSSHCTLQGPPPLHVSVHWLDLSHCIEHGGFVQTNVQSFPALHVQRFPHSFVPPLSTAASGVVVVPLDEAVPLLLLALPELDDDEDDDDGAPLPIVQS
jgi:hypothetical protein